MPLLHSRATLADKRDSEVNPRSFTTEIAAKQRQHLLYQLTNVIMCVYCIEFILQIQTTGRLNVCVCVCVCQSVAG
jgi:hypothetical protein